MSKSVTATAADFPFDGKLVEIPSTATIADALNTLVQHGVLSAPVYDEKAKYVVVWLLYISAVTSL